MNEIQNLLAKLADTALSDSELEQFCQVLVDSFGETINVNLRFDVQETSTVGFVNCIAYEASPIFGPLNAQILVFINIHSERHLERGECSIVADMLLFVRGSRVSRQHALTGEFFRFNGEIVEGIRWHLADCLGDEYSEYEAYQTP